MAIPRDENNVALTSVATAGQVPLYPSNPATTGVSTDVAIKWGQNGNTAINHLLISNNTTTNVNYELDAPTTAGSDILAPGQKLWLDVGGTLVVHLQAGSSVNVNGTSANNVVVRAWL